MQTLLTPAAALAAAHICCYTCRWLYGNKLKVLPPEIGKMIQLRKLWLDNNQLTELPEELGDCTALQVRMSGTYIA